MQKNPLEQYKEEMTERVELFKKNEPLQKTSAEFFKEIGIGKANYVYNFFWLGVPIIQIPQDLQALQEIIWEVKPDLIIEAGIAWGGTLMFSASMLAILEACNVIDKGLVIGIDIDIRQHNKELISSHPLSKKITMIEGSSIDKNIIDQVKILAKDYKRIMVCLDSNHTHDHVLAELETYAPYVSPGSYCVVGDTIIEDAPEGMVSKRTWGKGNSPKTAVWEYLKRLKVEGRFSTSGKRMEFGIDKEIENKIVLTGSPDGFLKRLS